MGTPAPNGMAGGGGRTWHFGLGGGVGVVWAKVADHALGARYRVQSVSEVL